MPVRSISGVIGNCLLGIVLIICLMTSSVALPVTGVASGDTLAVIDGGRALTVRLAYIDAPEPRQPYANHSRRSLSMLCAGKHAKLDVLYYDRQKRAIAVVYCGGINANRHQVASGMAWVDTQYNKDHAMPRLQEEARRKRLGVWQSDVVTPPWEYRRRGSGRLDGKRDFGE